MAPGCYNNYRAVKLPWIQCVSTGVMSFLLVQERRNSGANTLELHLSCTYPSMWNHQDQGVDWNTVMDCEGLRVGRYLHVQLFAYLSSYPGYFREPH